MEIGIVGLGRMGSNMAKRLARSGHNVIVHNRTEEKAYALAKEEEGILAVSSLNEMAKLLKPPRPVWVMLPAGDTTKHTVDDLVDRLSSGDTIIDGGNSHYTETLKIAEKVRSKG
ncbi:MAG: NAD(P)-binding domain-containing protein, partial [Nitrososphaerales archaeon]